MLNCACPQRPVVPSLPTRLTVTAPATSANLGPGFDCVGLALELRNSVQLTTLRDTTNLEIDITGEGAGELSRGPDNLVVVAMRHLYAKLGQMLPGLRLHLHNEVPLCSGLGSSAAAEISGLVAANALLGEPFSPRELLLVALELENHPDNIPPALLGGLCTAIAQHDEARGWVLDYVRLDPPAGLRAVLATAQVRIETVASRRRLPASYSRADAVHNSARAALLIAALAAGDWAALATALDDRFHQPYRLPHIPGAEATLAAARAAGAKGAVLSGSGPTLLAFCADDPAPVAEAMAAAQAAAGLASVVRVVDLSAAGATVAIDG